MPTPTRRTSSSRGTALAVVCALLLGMLVVAGAGTAAGATSAAAGPATTPLAQIDFGTAATVPVAGYALDYGQAYGLRTGANQGTGKTYGWVADGTSNPLDLSTSGRARTGTGVADVKQTTFVAMQLVAANPGSWEMAVDNGWYTVAVGLGDAAAVYDSTHSVTVEDSYAMAPYKPTADTRLKSGTVTVLVTDGRLTLRPQGGSNVKITFLTVTSTPAPAASTFPFRVDFGAMTSTPAPGYLLDYGQAFAHRDTGEYGWVADGTGKPLDMVSLGRQRSTAGITDVRQANFMHMQYAGATPGAWEMTVPNGAYRVTVGVGEANNAYDSTHAITVEDQSVITPYVPTYSTKFKQGTKDVVVTDGRLTVRATGGTNTKIDWLEVLDWSTPAAPQLPLLVDYGTSSSPMPTGYLNDSGLPYGARSGAYSYGWVAAGTSNPLDMTKNSRQRVSSYTTDPRLLSMLQMQPAGAAAGSWEVALPNGTYQVTVAVGDATTSYDSSHSIKVENTPAITSFVPSAGNRIRVATVVAGVVDGRLTIDATGGMNTKIDYVDIDAVDSQRPRVFSVAPGSDETDVVRDLSVTTELVLPSGAINPSTVNSTTVKLTNNVTNAVVPASVNTSGGGDVLVLTPSTTLDANTTYRFEVTAGITDVAGNAFLPFKTLFKTGTRVSGTGIAGVAFTKEDTSATGSLFTSTTFGPDGKLYAATLNGYIRRFPVAADGTLGAGQTIETVRTMNSGQDRTIIGLAFDPASTADNLILWVTDNYMYTGSSDVPDWSSKLDRLTGPDLATGQNVLVNLPRSAHDHEANSITFGPDGALYFPMGSNSGMGYPDVAWANRSEVQLSGAILRLDTKALPATLPLDVKTVDGGGAYNPYATGAPLTLYATGVRNAFDLVWHSNGRLYAPTNGSAAGSNLPTVDSPLPASCSTTRSDTAAQGAYSYGGPKFATIFGNPDAQTDFIHRISKSGYYGHPNPSRCEYIAYGGNPTAAVDAWEDTQYPVGVAPDRNFRSADVYDAGMHSSADGSIEYKSNVFGGLLKGKLLVVRYSANKDIMVVDPSGADGTITGIVTGVTGFTGFSEPLDITENPNGSGILYVTELGGDDIKLLRPKLG